MTEFEVKGIITVKKQTKKFTKKVTAPNEKMAREFTYCLIGSNHKMPRRFISINEVKQLA